MKCQRKKHKAKPSKPSQSRRVSSTKNCKRPYSSSKDFSSLSPSPSESSGRKRNCQKFPLSEQERKLDHLIPPDLFPGMLPKIAKNLEPPAEASTSKQAAPFPFPSGPVTPCRLAGRGKGSGRAEHPRSTGPYLTGGPGKAAAPHLAVAPLHGPASQPPGSQQRCLALLRGTGPMHRARRAHGGEALHWRKSRACPHRAQPACRKSHKTGDGRACGWEAPEKGRNGVCSHERGPMHLSE